MNSFWWSLIPSAIRLSTPLTLASLGGYFSERVGVVNIGLEGLMLIGAFGAAAGNYHFQSPGMGLLCGIGASLVFALFHAMACVVFRADQVVSGMALNILAFGAAPLLSNAFFGSSGTTPTIENAYHVAEYSVPGLSDIPGVGLFFGPYTPLVYVSLLAVFAAHFWSYYTASGLRFRAVGDHPAAADSLGVDVQRTRFFCVLASGVFCGLAGAFLSIEHSASFSRNMTAGRGFLALTALIFGQWRPIPAFLACLLFGWTDALQIRLQGAELPGIGALAPQFIQMLPYVVAMAVLATFIGRARQPKSLGTPYSRN